MIPMNWKQKILDELISQKTFFGLIFVIMLSVVNLTEPQADVFKTLIYAVLGASAVKSLAGAAKVMVATKKESSDGTAEG